MSYFIKIEAEGFDFAFGAMGIGSGLGLYIDFEDNKIIKAIEQNDSKLLYAIKFILSQRELLDAQYTMTNFEHYYLQGHPWHDLKHLYSFSELFDIRRKADLILVHKNECDSYQKEIAQLIIQTLDGNPPKYERIEKSPEEKARSRFENKKPRLRTQLVIRDGYKCDNCGKSDEDSLCIKQKEFSNINYELENLTLRCRSCSTKMKKK
jgi:hypothetical protein